MYLCVPEQWKWERCLKTWTENLHTLIFFFFIFPPFCKKDVEQGLLGKAGQGLGPQQSLPKQSTTPGCAEWLGKGVTTAQMCWRQVCTGGHLVGSLLAQISSPLTAGEERPI